MTQRFVLSSAVEGGTISIATGESTALGSGTLFSGRDRAGAQLWAQSDTGAWVRVGVVAEVDPEGEYENLQLPLVSTYNGPDLVDADYELVDGPAIANGATQAAIYARFNASMGQNAGLFYNSADNVDLSLIHNNSMWLDDVTRTLYAYRDGVLEVVYVVSAQWTPRGLHSLVVTYAKNDFVQAGNFVFVSNAAGNLNHAPNTAPASTAYWTYVPLPTVQQVLDTLGIHQITVSTNFPSGGVNGDLWFRVA